MSEPIKVLNLSYSALDLCRFASREKDGRVVRWRCVDLQKKVLAEFSASGHERTVAKWLRELKLTPNAPRTSKRLQINSLQPFSTFVASRG